MPNETSKRTHVITLNVFRTPCDFVTLRNREQSAHLLYRLGQLLGDDVAHIHEHLVVVLYPHKTSESCRDEFACL